MLAAEGYYNRPVRFVHMGTEGLSGRMRVLLLAEGDAETRASWSGSSGSVLLELRSRGHGVIAGDVKLHRSDGWITAGLTFSPDGDVGDVVGVGLGRFSTVGPIPAVALF